MGKRNAKEENLYQFLQEAVRECGAELIDLRRVKENGKIYLRLFIDKKNGVGIDDCERVNQKVDPMLDERGEDGHDFLEVQSPGLDRPLTELKEFLLHLEEEIEVKLYRKREERKSFTGNLLRADETGFAIREASGNEESFTYEETANVKRTIHF